MTLSYERVLAALMAVAPRLIPSQCINLALCRALQRVGKHLLAAHRAALAPSRRELLRSQPVIRRAGRLLVDRLLFGFRLAMIGMSTTSLARRICSGMPPIPP